MQDQEQEKQAYLMDAMDVEEDNTVVLQEVLHVQHVLLVLMLLKFMQHHVMDVKMDIIVLEA